MTGTAHSQVITPIICEGDAIGAVIIMSREPRAKFSDPELRLAATAARFPRAADGKLRKRRDLKRQEFHPLIKL